jgi:hypothetical protein
MAKNFGTEVFAEFFEALDFGAVEGEVEFY